MSTGFPKHVKKINTPAEDAVSASSARSAKSKLRRRKIAHVLISGVGFLADAYDLFVIDFVVALLSATAFAEFTAGDKSLIVSATHAGAVCGQLFFGVAADFIGRRVMFITTAMLVICGSLLSSLVGWGYRVSAQPFSIVYQLALCRFFLGFGIGGEYPLSATVASETESEEELSYGISSDAESKGFLWYLSHKPNSIAAVFSMQGIGMLLSPLFVMSCVALGISLETTWRLCLAVGAVPSAIAFVFRWRMSETEAFKKTQRDYSQAESAATATTALYYPTPRAPSSVSETSSPTPVAADGGRPITTTATSSDGQHDHLELAVVGTTPTAAGSPVAPMMSPSPIMTRTALAVSLDGSEIEKRERRSWKSFGKHLRRSWRILKQFRWILLGTSATWFLIDVTLYGTGSFKSAVVGKWFLETETTLAPTPLVRNAHGNAPILPNAAPRSLLYLSNENDLLRRPLDFGSSRVQRQRDQLRYLLESFAAGGATAGDFSSSKRTGALAAATDKIDVAGPTVSSKRRRLLAHVQNAVARRLSADKDDPSAYRKMLLQAEMGALIALMAIPGYFLSLFLIHKTGTKLLQLWGFVAVAVVFIGLGVEQLLGGGLKILELILFGLTFLCSNFGPNTTTFILPTQLYPTLVRATCHGFSAAMGKLGGVLGTSCFSVLERDVGMGWLLTICGVVAILGVPFTLLIPSDREAKERLVRDEMELTRLRQEREKATRSAAHGDVKVEGKKDSGSVPPPPPLQSLAVIV